MPLLLLAWGKSALGWLSGLSWKVWAGVAALVLVAGVWLHGRSTGADGVQAKWDAQEAVYAQQRAASAIAARDTEARWRAEYKAIAERFLAEQKVADEKYQSDLASLRAGSLRVRERFACPARSAEAPAFAGGAGEAGPGGLLSADAEFLLREAARADEVARQLNALIQAVEAGQR